MEDQVNIKGSHDVLLGIVAAFSLILLLWGYCWFKSYSSFRLPQTINVIFHEVAGLNDNGAVYLDGVRVGMVQKMEWQAPHHVLVQLLITRGKVEIPRGSKFDILTNGIVGAKYVEIILPETQAGEKPPPISSSDEVMGEDPVRPELAVNKLAIGLSDIDMDKLENNIEADRKRMVRAADQLSTLAEKTMPIIDRTPKLEESVTAMSTEMGGVAHKLNRVLSNQNLPADLKETAAQAHQTAESLRLTMHELSSTLSDKGLREDLIKTLQQLKETSQNIQSSVETVQKISSDKSLRTDVKDILVQAHQDLDKVNEILSDQSHTGDLKSTLQDARSALTDLDVVARQLQQVLNKRQPFLHLMFGRPGFLKDGTKAAGEKEGTNKE